MSMLTIYFVSVHHPLSCFHVSAVVNNAVMNMDLSFLMIAFQRAGSQAPEKDISVCLAGGWGKIYISKGQRKNSSKFSKVKALRRGRSRALLRKKALQS